MTTLPQALEGSRCILHIDLEQVRLGISSEVPAAVQQWHSLIAVNYPARKAGVQRHCTVNDAKELCPDIQFLHVPTYAAGEKEPKYRENPDRQTQKVSLDPYRAASKKIFQIFHKHCDKLQKIGLDEAFMDVTTTINKRLENFIDQNPQMLEKVNDEECGTKLDWNKVGYVLESKEEEERKKAELYWSKTTWKDLQLYIGAELAAEIRKEIFDTLGYTCSAGIAHYKTVAKLCSSKNKPNKQTVLRLTAVSNFMETVPFTKIRNLGGKLGSEIESELSVDKASDLWPYSIQDLQKKFGPSTGLYLHNICRGIDNEEIIPAKAPKSIMASKSFNPVVENMQDMDKWFSILAIELHNRLMLNYEEYNTWPKSFSVMRYACCVTFSKLC
ncbi:DNA-directed DNA polymerase eta rad30 [Rhizopus stolonifer]|uniref:DNA-directed DNA polymerase eta rad30 n=1 Tax=Rhizopus stolonifer TaxID=4846 RepID=A0A367KIN5_RHIST|nr:DNA-directed DNA polymerase eta rad30 [Rhizopus stolonifer]